MRSLYPELDPYWSGRLTVSSLHELYVETSGNPNGMPVLFVHGGPGSGTVANQRRFFNPRAYRIVLFDQRGCGRSTPYASLDQNTTWDLVDDMERIREYLGIDRWVLFGGSWGSTLSLAYAETHPDRVLALVIWGVFLIRPAELAWFYQSGASFLFPDLWDVFVAPIPLEERDDLLRAYHQRLTGDDAEARSAAARAWTTWESSLTGLILDPDYVARITEPHHADAVARIESHYYVNHGFFSRPNQLLDGVDAIRHIPAVIVQGRYDVVCPLTGAWDLHRQWPEAALHIVDAAGHSSRDPGMTDRLVEGTDALVSTQPL